MLSQEVALLRLQCNTRPDSQPSATAPAVTAFRLAIKAPRTRAPARCARTLLDGFAAFTTLRPHQPKDHHGSGSPTTPPGTCQAASNHPFSLSYDDPKPTQTLATRPEPGPSQRCKGVRQPARAQTWPMRRGAQMMPILLATSSAS